MSTKELFIKYLESKSRSGSRKPHSYAKAMEVLEDVLFAKSLSKEVSVWDFINEENVLDLYEFVILQQKNVDGIFKDYKPSSYWKNNYCSSALKEFHRFLALHKSQKKQKNKPQKDNISFNLSAFNSALKTANLILSENLPHRFIAALQTKPLVILTGLSGSGKTKLAEAFSLWITESKNQYCMVAVGADWTNREPLLGFPNALDNTTYVKPECGALDLILRAANDQTKPYFLILDEMNMSHVERYFADFLSGMESTNKTINLHSGSEDMEGDGESLAVPSTVDLPPNLFIIGTVNIDDTTYMFSPKVLDRANVIEFRVSKDEMTSYFKTPTELNMDSLVGAGATMGESFVTAAKERGLIAEDLDQVLMPFFSQLQDGGAEFGYRTAAEISRFVKICTDLADNSVMNKDDIIDAAIMQKLLPKVHGSRNKIENILKELGKLCLKTPGDDPFLESNNKPDIKYSLSHAKLKRMHKRVISDGFTSFAEA